MFCSQEVSFCFAWWLKVQKDTSCSIFSILGTEVVESGKRRLVDAHWFRGNSYLKIGWKWVQRAFVKGYELITQLRLSPLHDPEPAMASRKQAKERDELSFSVRFEVYTPYETCLS
jgi:hypothetical protein